ncbi:hypothetical protein ACFPC0_27765 [Streptomyces andamanensis]|uniref:Uncharacterized protein n=1 Tax=Streptomyces andamanensis TaxID=1565035 RepID=A0ABV8TLS9_9ACTN
MREEVCEQKRENIRGVGRGEGWMDREMEKEREKGKRIKTKKKQRGGVTGKKV